MDRFLTAIYCEDIRHEVGNKRSLMGVFSSTIFVTSFPLVLPKLCIAIQLSTTAKIPVKRVQLKILKDDKELFVGEINEGMITAGIASAPQVDGVAPEDVRVIVGGDIIMANLVLEAPTTIRLRAVTETEELKGPGLLVRRAPNGESSVAGNAS